MKNNASEKIDDQDTSSYINKLTEDPIVRSYGDVKVDNFTEWKTSKQDKLRCMELSNIRREEQITDSMECTGSGSFRVP
jgi:hypothetical protein